MTPGAARLLLNTQLSSDLDSSLPSTCSLSESRRRDDTQAADAAARVAHLGPPVQPPTSAGLYLCESESDEAEQSSCPPTSDKVQEYLVTT